MPPRIVVVGSANTDLVVRVPKLPRPGETVPGGRFKMVAGGKGANQAVAAARAGVRVAFVANIGRDEFGNAAVESLRREGIDMRYIVRDKSTPSGVALIMVDGRGENLITVARGSNDRLRSGHIDAARSAIRRARCVVVQLETPWTTVRRAIDLAVRNAVPALLNPAPARPVPKRVLQQVTFLTPNESELSRLTGLPTRQKSDIETAAGKLHAAGVKHVMVTCGARGVCSCGADGLHWYPAPKVNAIDTVGAGDCFSGTFAARFAEGKSIVEAIRFAVTAASLSVTRPGAQPSMPYRREILRMKDLAFAQK